MNGSSSMLLRVSVSVSTSSSAMSSLLMGRSTHVSFSSGLIVKIWSIDPFCKSSVLHLYACHVCMCVCFSVCVFVCLCVCVFVHVRA